MFRPLNWCCSVARCRVAAGPSRHRHLHTGGIPRKLHHQRLLWSHWSPAGVVSSAWPVPQAHRGSVPGSSAAARDASTRWESPRVTEMQSGLTSQSRQTSPYHLPGPDWAWIGTSRLHTSSRLEAKGTDWVQGLKEAPRPALVLGLSGLIPFVAPAAYTAVTFSVGPSLLWAQLAYGASILSFLGGIRWGYALTAAPGGPGPTWGGLGYSVLPSLAAWLGLLMPGLQAGQLCLMAGLFGAWAADAGYAPYPAWFRSLRLLLSLGALLSLGVSYGFCLVYEPTSKSHGSNVMKLIKIVQIILED